MVGGMLWLGFFALLFITFFFLWATIYSFMAWRRDQAAEKGLDKAIDRQFQGRE